MYSQISISRSCGDYFYKFELPEVQINFGPECLAITLAMFDILLLNQVIMTPSLKDII